MERLQGPIDPCFLGEHLDVDSLQRGFANAESFRFEVEEEEEARPLMPSLEDKIPFLQMLQSVEYPPFFPIKEPNFQTLLKLQHLRKQQQQPWEMTTNNITETETQIVQAAALDHESCVTHDVLDLHSPVKSESQDLQNPHSCSWLESVSPKPNNQRTRANSGGSSFPWTLQQTMLSDTRFSKSSSVVPRERRKRKRTRPTKNKEEVESQRMTHIAVERNRRRQMNDHLNSLRSLMPPSYVQRGDQASIIGGAIDFVKELEQLLQSLEAQKRIRTAEEAEANIGISSNGLFTSQQLDCNGNCEEESKVKRKSEVAEIEVTAVHNHVNLKIECENIPGQLLRAIVALEELRLTVLHLNITSSETTVLYSFNLKMEEDCKLGSADEVAATVGQIFSIINDS